jgi:hypothetical protein
MDKAETVCMQMYIEIYGIVVGDIYLNDKTMKKFDALGEKYRQLEKDQMLDFGEFIIDELEPMAQNRKWVEERYNYFKSE